MWSGSPWGCGPRARTSRRAPTAVLNARGDRLNDQLRTALHWALLFLIITLPSWLFERAVSGVLVWLVSCAYDVAPGLAARLPLELLLNFGRIFAFYGMAGFTYCWLMDEDWRRSGLISGLVFMAFEYGLLMSRVGAGALLSTP